MTPLPPDAWRAAVLCGLSQESLGDVALLRLSCDQYLRVPVPPSLFQRCHARLGRRVWVDIDGRSLQLSKPVPATAAPSRAPLNAVPQAAPWRQGLPRHHTHLVVVPLHYSSHADEEACASKLNGFDAQGQRCFVRHDHTAVVAHFDIDECLHEVPVQHERRSAWRLHDGRWLHTLDRVLRLDSCVPAVQNHLVLVTSEQQLGF